MIPKLTHEIPYYLYIVIKDRLSKLITDNTKFVVIASVILTLISTPITYTILSLFYIYRQIIIFLLRNVVLKDRFIGMMEGIDSCCCNQQNCTPAPIIFLEFDKTFDELVNNVKTLIANTMKTKHKKLFYTWDSFFGYHYYRTNDLKASDYIRVIDDCTIDDTLNDHAAFSAIFAPYHKYDIPNRTLFQIVLCPKKLRLSEFDQEVYAIMFRIHHAVGDGRAILSLFHGVFSDSKNLLGNFFGSPPAKNCRKKESFMDFLLQKNIKDWLFDTVDDNQLIGHKLSDDKHIVWFSDNTSKYMDITRRLRKAVKGLTFLDVINTAISCSFYDYYKQKRLDIPKSIIGGVALVPDTISFCNHGPNDFEMCNRFCAAIIHLPIDVESDDYHKIITRMKLVMEQYQLIRKCVDLEFNYWLVQEIFVLLPYQIYKYLGRQIPITVGISGLPCCKSFTLFGGCKVKDYIMMMPNTPTSGIHIFTHNYDGKFRLTATIDRSLIESYEDAQQIVDGCIMYIDKLNSLCETSLL